MRPHAGARAALLALGLAGVAAPPAAGAGASLAPPAGDYVLHCAGCHRFDGSGSARVPSLGGLAALAAAPAGRAYLVRVPGVAQAPLADARLAALLNWVLAEFSGGPPQPAFTAGEVGSLRTAPLRDPARVRAALAAVPERAEGAAAPAGSPDR